MKKPLRKKTAPLPEGSVALACHGCRQIFTVPCRLIAKMATCPHCGKEIITYLRFLVTITVKNSLRTLSRS